MRSFECTDISEKRIHEVWGDRFLLNSFYSCVSKWIFPSSFWFVSMSIGFGYRFVSFVLFFLNLLYKIKWCFVSFVATTILLTFFFRGYIYILCVLIAWCFITMIRMFTSYKIQVHVELNLYFANYRTLCVINIVFTNWTSIWACI